MGKFMLVVLICCVHSGFPFDIAQGGEPVEPRTSFSAGKLGRNDGFLVPTFLKMI
jgi:hypothetical protein